MQDQPRYDPVKSFTHVAYIGSVANVFVVHPSVPARTTGELIAYGYQAKGDLSDDIAIYSFDPQGNKTWEAWIKSPYLGIIHDIAITENYVIVPVISRTTNLERLRSGEGLRQLVVFDSTG